MIAAPDIQLATERPVMLEWRDAGGVWVMPAEVVESRLYPFPTTSLRPAGASECVSPPASATAPSASPAASSSRPAFRAAPACRSRARTSTAGELVLWTILPLERGDVLDIVANTGGDRLEQARVRVTHSAPQSGSWLARVACRPVEEARSVGRRARRRRSRPGRTPGARARLSHYGPGAARSRTSARATSAAACRA